jgi:hypothetical protein
MHLLLNIMGMELVTWHHHLLHLQLLIHDYAKYKIQEHD